MTEERKMVERTSNFHDFNENSSLEGTLREFKETENGKSAVVELADKSRVMAGTYTALSGKLEDGDIGKYVRITKTGEQKSNKSGRTYFTFRVEVEE